MEWHLILGRTDLLLSWRMVGLAAMLKQCRARCVQIKLLSSYCSTNFSAAQVAHGRPGSNAELMQPTMIANHATAQLTAAQGILLNADPCNVSHDLHVAPAGPRAALHMCACSSYNHGICWIS